MGITVGVWRIADQGPVRLSESPPDLEQQLENWLEQDPSLVQNGLTIVGRQFATAAGPLDLLAVDPLGRWVVIEIKKGTVRREAVAQAIDYAACIATMPAEELASKVDAYLTKRPGPERTLEDILKRGAALPDAEAPDREIAIAVVGTSRDAGLDRMVDFLAQRSELAISVVAFSVFEVAPGQRVLVREISETEDATQPAAFSVDAVVQRARDAGVGGPFVTVFEGLTQSGLPYRPFKASIMFGAPENRARCLITVDSRPTRNGKLNVYVASKTIEEMIGVPAEKVRAEIGDGWLELPDERVAAFTEAAVSLIRDALAGSDA